SERAHADDPEVRIAHHDRVGGTPLVAGEQAGDDIIDVGLERRLEAEPPSLQAREDGDVFRRELVFARSEGIPELAEIDELHHLALADDEIGAPLDLAILVRPPIAQGVPSVVLLPLNDFPRLGPEEAEDAHIVVQFRIGLLPGLSWVKVELAAEEQD